MIKVSRVSIWQLFSTTLTLSMKVKSVSPIQDPIFVPPMKLSGLEPVSIGAVYSEGDGAEGLSRSEERRVGKEC